MIDKLQALQLRSAVSRDEALLQRQIAWQKVNDEAPTIAQLLRDINEKMGKPTAVAIKMDEKLVMRNGQFDQPKDMSVVSAIRKRW